jgi:cell division protein FtsB
VEIERLARERYGMVRPGETLYVVSESTAVLDARGR